MKLEKDVITHIQRAVKTAKLLGIDDICIENGLTRAMREDRAVLIVDPNEIELPFDVLGIARIPQFLDRLSIVAEMDGFAIECTDNGDFVKSVVMKCKGTRIDFKCSNPSNIVAPRKLADEMTYGMEISDETISMLTKSATAMKAETVTIVSNDDGVSFEMNDVNNDVFKHEMDGKVVILDGQSSNFAFRYPTKLLISLLRNNVNYLEIAKKGSLKINLNGLDTFVIPKV